MSSLQCTAVTLIIFKEKEFKTMLSIQNKYLSYTEEQKNQILEIISDQYCRKILSTIKKGHKSPIEVSEETKIPISTVYRRLQTLHDAKLLRISGIINEDGKKSFLYKSKIKSISTYFEGDCIEIEVVRNSIDELQDR